MILFTYTYRYFKSTSRLYSTGAAWLPPQSDFEVPNGKYFAFDTIQLVLKDNKELSK
jgi:hypothetical protein